jgi:hypothetical protein
MRKLIIVAVAVSASIVLTGCGSGGAPSSSSGDNAAKIDRAKAADTGAAEVHRKLARGLTLHSYAGVNDVFTVAVGNEVRQCDIDVIAAGAEASSYSGDPDTLVSPDGQVAVKVGEFEGTPAASCLEAVDTALGWH